MSLRSVGLALVVSVTLQACASPKPPEAAPRDPNAGAPAAPSEPDAAASAPAPVAVGTDACQRDGDCVPAQCCHPAACIARENAPSCQDVMCTMECRPQTLDCGGACLCRDGRCTAKLNELGPPAEGR